MLADPQEFYHLRLRVTAASFPTPLLICSHREDTLVEPRVGGFVEPETMVTATEGLRQPAVAEAAQHPPTDRLTHPTHPHALICQGETHRVKGPSGI